MVFATPPAVAWPTDAIESNAIFLGSRMPYDAFDRLPATRLEVSGSILAVAFAPGALDLSQGQVRDWIHTSARAVAAYYGRFPVASARILVVPRVGRGVGPGRAWAHRGAAVRVGLGERSNGADLARDWVLVHEMVHLAFPSVPDRHHWIEEGLASYVEAIARAQAGQLSAQKVWADLVAGLPQGLPQPGDRGLDNTPTWGRTYWGGALYCLLADLEIRRRTGNRFGLQHALRAILDAGSMESSSALAPLLAIGDRATGVPVLAEFYAEMKDAPAPVDLEALWRRLGVRADGSGVSLDDAAPEAAIRRAITAPWRG
ncbi:MAG: hypothetical protein WAO95_03850 [Burkholderiales bacterium]